MAKARRVKGIDCNGPAGDGIRLVLKARFAEMTKFRADALNWSDPEGVHSMRVGTRRIRSAVRDFTPYMRKRGLRSAVQQIKVLATSLGNVRDQDVAIMALEKLQSEAAAEAADVINQLITARKKTLETARVRLTKRLVKTELRQLASKFAAAVESATAPRKVRGKSAQPQLTYLEMARAIISDRLKDLEKLSNSLYRPLKVEPLHDMRIAAKRLRYAIELFHECWGEGVKPFADEIAKLQLSLGELHDCDLWIESFGDHIISSKKEHEQSQTDAFAWLLSHFIKTRNEHLRDAFMLWREWEVHNVSSKLRDEIGPDIKETASA